MAVPDATALERKTRCTSDCTNTEQEPVWLSCYSVLMSNQQQRNCLCERGSSTDNHEASTAHNVTLTRAVGYSTKWQGNRTHHQEQQIRRGGRFQDVCFPAAKNLQARRVCCALRQFYCLLALLQELIVINYRFGLLDITHLGLHNAPIYGLRQKQYGYK